MLATRNCPNITTEQFPEGSEPTEYCTAHPGPPLHPIDKPADGAATIVPASGPATPAPAPLPHEAHATAH
jgi:hypothetical protein